jgi:hypothetical protein
VKENSIRKGINLITKEDTNKLGIITHQFKILTKLIPYSHKDFYLITYIDLIDVTNVIELFSEDINYQNITKFILKKLM